ncbi:ATP-binding protein [Cytobacillus oceanisediminis]|uniref:ATP-binding protein n=1 Tax=Cytobacillus oceanisediminis TaxID=665099 RepID=UPI00203E334B|nr:ATP-binding protein [Cytobacillus oceanisediminis]MCM3404271.1 ATP-binding protein [Cytobacillus oceanisediminis]
MLPPRFVRDTMYGILDKAITSDLEPADELIKFNFRNLTYIEPVGITILSNLFQWLKKRNVRVQTVTPTEIKGGRNCPLTYLDDSMFFKKYIKKTLTPHAAVRPTTRPLEHVTYANSYQWLPSVFIPWLSGQLGVGVNSLDDIKVSIEEIFNNINDHSSENIGCIYAQHYPNINRLKISISDFGIGIPGSIQRKYVLSDSEALMKSIQEGFSTESTPGNRGAGLNNLLTSIVKFNQGTVNIHSNKGILECNYGNNDIQASSYTAPGFYPGTLIEVVLNTNNIYENEEEDFEWFL